METQLHRQNKPELGGSLGPVGRSVCYWVGDTCWWIQREARIIYAPGLSLYKAVCCSLIIDGVDLSPAFNQL